MKKQLLIILIFLFSSTSLFASPTGDVNSDGDINIIDALLIARYYVGMNITDFDEAAADVNTDGTVTINDALIIAQYYVGLIDTLPVFPQGKGVVFGTVEYLETTGTEPTFVPIPGAFITIANKSTGTDERGFFRITDLPEGEFMMTIKKEGYLGVYKPVTTLNGESLNLRRILLQAADNSSISAIAGGTSISANGLGEVIFSPGSFFSSTGEVYSGEVDVHMNTIIPQGEGFFENYPGSYRGTTSGGDQVDIASYGVITTEIYDPEGHALELSQEYTAELRLKVYYPEMAPGTIPMWHLDEKSGKWIEEGNAYLVGDEFVGQVSHFTSWNFGVVLSGPRYLVEGHVKDEQGTPVSGARVTLASRNFAGVFMETRAGEDGGYSFTVNPNGQNPLYYIRAAIWSESDNRTFYLDNTDVTDLELIMRIPDRRLMVYDDTYTPMENLIVMRMGTGEIVKTFRLTKNNIMAVEITDIRLTGSGSFTLESMPNEGPWTVSNKEHLSFRVRFTPSGDQEKARLFIGIDFVHDQPCFIINLEGGTEISEPLVTPPDRVISFPDPNLEEEIRQEINKPVEDIRMSDIEGILQLGARGGGIQDLTGLSNLVNLTYLNLSANEISDMSGLSSLVNLVSLELRGNEITDVSGLSSLVNLTHLYLDGNNISDIVALSSLVNLIEFSISNNKMTDVRGFTSLVNLASLGLDSNQIADISELLSLVNLTFLGLWDNPLSQESINSYIPQLEAQGTSVGY